jgi:hypothetical protein
MPKESAGGCTIAARDRIAQVRAALGRFELVCSGNLAERMMKCGKPNCSCATDPSARHGPYYEWARMRAGKTARRYVTAQQAEILRQAIDNYHEVEKLLRSWEVDSERIIDADYPRES